MDGSLSILFDTNTRAPGRARRRVITPTASTSLVLLGIFVWALSHTTICHL